MSRVMPNHVLRVGQTICVSSQEDHAHLQPNGYSPCHTSPSQYLYYSVEGWDRQISLTQGKGGPLPKMEHYDSCKPAEATPMKSPNLGDKCLPEEPTEMGNDSCPEFSPTLDVSIDKLNRLILEIDPTFQPLQLNTIQSQNCNQAVPQSSTAVASKQEPESPDIKYIEMSPARAKCQESRQNSASPPSAPHSTSPPNHCPLFPHGGTRSSGHMTFGVGHDPGGPQYPTGRQSPACIRVSESISIPQQDQKGYGPSSLLPSSPGFENLRKLSQHGRMVQRCSEASLLSTSPGSDTSYILGSSSQSLSNNEPDTPQTRSTGSPSSVGSLNGSSLGSCSSGSYYPGVNCPQKGNSPLPQLFQKGQTQSCFPSPVTSSPSPVPIVLINGRLEDSEMSSKPYRNHPGSFKQKMPLPSSGSFSGAGSSNKTSSESSFSSSSSLDSYSKETQATMKFVMDTSKYWFKPSITRDQAVQMLAGEPPGTFIMRDSTSYHGSFGMAMKVFGGKTGEDGSDPIRHFLIESSARGVHLKGAEEEPYFGSLSAFVYQHTIMPLALPCRLVIPSQDFFGGRENPAVGSEATLPVSMKAAVCNLLYLHSLTMETLTGKAAVRKAVSATFELEVPPTPIIVHFKVTHQGITLTDIQRKVFFRRHYPLAGISFCDMDPENRKWQKFSKISRIFGVIAKSPADSENICHLFAEYDAVHPASHIVDYIKKLLPAA